MTKISEVKKNLKEHFGLIAFAVLFPLVGVSCCSFLPSNVNTHTDNRPQIDSWLKSTVAFVTERPELPGRKMPYCTGFFISERRLMTTAHCFTKTITLPLPGGRVIEVPTGESPLGETENFMRYGDLDIVSMMPIRDPQQATLVYYDRQTDIAILDLANTAQSSENYLSFSHDNPSIGDRVYSIGHPISLAWTLSDGSVSRVLSINHNDMIDYIQANNGVAPGCSGGPLLNERGQIIGMTEANIDRLPQLGIFISANRLRIALTNLEMHHLSRAIGNLISGSDDDDHEDSPNATIPWAHKQDSDNGADLDAGPGDIRDE